MNLLLAKPILMVIAAVAGVFFQAGKEYEKEQEKK